jgi:hypothetical protein
MAISNQCNSYVSWGAILAGAVLASAFSIVMMQFGSAIGFSATNIANGDVLVTPAKLFAVGFWILWIQVMASGIGGYIAGRLRQPLENASSHESEVRDGAHGVMVWATATLGVFVAGAAAAAIAALVPAVTPAHQAVQSADILANHKAVAVISAFSMAAISLVSAVTAWYAAAKGGDHRDSGVDLSGYFSFKR